MAQQQRNTPDSEQHRTLGGKSRRGGSNNVIIGTVIVIGAIVFSFVFFGNWEGADIGRTESAGGTADGEAAATAPTYGEGEPADVEGVPAAEQ
ncbi:hypothetical protein DLJ49_07985 [Rhodovulum sp. 12E13]|uniref:hypothetical protein n=1 Tax=Rhodovulum sp. 12E13 TaxID=2203891 RepID=UPI000E15299A|nr:hypothetical protein [Rhodovulum sp. 12E13]RDC73050.1 hypothetical protein DLJ49_07985 [Rhodovulum sp. 12E13]